MIETSDGITRTIALLPRSVADFHQAVMSTLKGVGIEVQIRTIPQEVADPIPFEQDTQHATCNSEHTQQFWRILVQFDRLLTIFRARYTGKCSPVHFFWSSFDLAVPRFSGRCAPEHLGGVPGMADWVTREACSHEVSSCGFWFGQGVTDALFYGYTYPVPAGFKNYPVQPQTAFFSSEMQEFILPYEAVR